MEALGALRSERKRKEKENLEDKVKAASPKKSELHKISDEKRLEIITENALYLYPDPPINVVATPFAAGAHVIWETTPLKENEKPVTDWEICRYRRNSYYSEWQFKGSDWIDVENNPENKFQCEFLTNGYEYCFSVGSRNKKGDSIHSLLSAAIYVDADLPNGWSRFFDEKKKKYYYYNLKTKQNSWTRPELDPYFVKHSVMVNFEQREIKHLISIYEEELAHFGCIYKGQFIHILKEIGEEMSKRAINNLFSKWGSTDDTIKSWPEFMDTMSAIKNSHVFAMLAKMAAEAALNKKSEDGNENEVTDEIRYFLEPTFNERMISTFDFQFVESLKNIFSFLDVNVEGKFTVEYLNILLESLEIETDGSNKSRLIMAIDQNNNDKFEFSEMCKMVILFIYFYNLFILNLYYNY
jgi:Ca2+-binding EF-hand superfamily protein